MKLENGQANAKGHLVTRDISDAFKMSVVNKNGGYGSGQLEDMHERMDFLAGRVGQLIEMLHERRELTDEQVMDLLGYGWRQV